MSRAGLALRAARLLLTRAVADTTPDYDIASSTYDEAFTALMGPNSTAMLDLVGIAPGMDVIELACGTGHLSEQIRIRQQGLGSLRVIEKSPGMLAVAKAKMETLGQASKDVSWQQGDMLEFLKAQATNSADAIVCGWAICYSKPSQLFREARRVLRPGGRIGIIESRADALASLRKAFEDVVADEPTLLTAMVRVALPKDAETVARWMRKGELRVINQYEGEQRWPVATAEEAVEWVERSGAGAGFRDSFDMSREDDVRGKLTEALRKQASRPGGLTLLHPFVVVVAETTPEPAAPVQPGVTKANGIQ